MAETGRIRVNFGTLKANYPTYNNLSKPLQDFMDGLNKPPKPTPQNPNPKPGHNTPCCVQMSEALNKTGQLIPSNSSRPRLNSPIGGYYYILAVDEFEDYLSGRYGRVEDIKNAPSGKRSTNEMKQYLNGKQGILLFRDTGYGNHIELWNKTHFVQDGSAGALIYESEFDQPRVLFWEVIEETPGLDPVPGWLRGWWKVTDPITYYYYFSDQYVVTYTKVEPTNVLDPPVRQPSNEGVVTVSQNSTVVVIDWNPADGGQTKETFTCLPARTDSMSGVSNRYGPLSATKMWFRFIEW